MCVCLMPRARGGLDEGRCWVILAQARLGKQGSSSGRHLFWQRPWWRGREEEIAGIATAAWQAGRGAEEEDEEDEETRASGAERSSSACGRGRDGCGEVAMAAHRVFA